MNKKEVKTFDCKSIRDLKQIAQEILHEFKETRVFVLIGDLGAGKTTIVKEFVSLLGVQDEISSPTFSIINEYQDNAHKIYHIDLYRLDTLEQAIEIGIEDYINSDHYCFIEWPQIIENILPEKVLLVKMETTGIESRKIIVNLI